MAGRAGGLRERKKAKTRAAIQAEALRLFGERGYDATTVDDIIEAVQVSASTFYRYFPTKADLVLPGTWGPMLVDALAAQPPHLAALPALRGALRTLQARASAEALDHAFGWLSLAASIPDLRAALMSHLASLMPLIAVAVAARAGRAPEDPAVRALAGAAVGVGMGVLLAATDNPPSDFRTLLDESLAQLEIGLTI